MVQPEDEMATVILGLLMAIGLATPEFPSGAQATQCYINKEEVNDYLWRVYIRTPKVDATGDFTSKDPKAAAFVGMTLKQYVIGGMKWNFKLRLFFALKAMEEDGLTPGITSAFRDDFRQRIAAGHKSAVGNSFHGGSNRGGYGNGLAVDMVSLNGATRKEQMAQSEVLWHWVDTEGHKFGLGRPYGDRDAPHIAPLRSAEYQLYRTRLAQAKARHRHHRLAMRHKQHRHHYAGRKNQTVRG